MLQVAATQRSSDGCPWDGVRILGQKYCPELKVMGMGVLAGARWGQMSWQHQGGTDPCPTHDTAMGLCPRPPADGWGDPGLLLAVKELRAPRRALAQASSSVVFFSGQKSPLWLFCRRLCQGHLVPASRRLRMGHLGRWGSPGSDGLPLRPPTAGGVTRMAVTRGL